MPYLTPPVSLCCLLRYIGYQERETDPSGSYLHVWVEPEPHPVAPPVEETLTMTLPLSNPSYNPLANIRPELPAPTDVAARLQKAFAKAAEEEARVPLAAVEALHDDLEAYSALVQKRAEEKALSMMLVAVGETAPPPTDLAPVQTKLRSSLKALLEILDGPFVCEVGPEPAPLTNPAPSNENTDEDEAPSSSEDFDPEDIRAVIARVETLSVSKWKQFPSERLLPMIQAYAAEIRHWQESVPTTSHFHWQLGQSVKMLAAIKYESGLKEFVKGLAHDHTGDWVVLAAEANARIRKYDEDAARALLPKKPKQAKVEKPEPEPVSHSWPALPRLRATLAKKPLLFIGGISVPNKIESVMDRFGFEVEWIEVYRNKGDANATSRVNSGTAGAIIILEKFLGHRTSEKIIEVCKQKGIPYAYGGNAGLATLQRAFELLDGKIAA